MSHLIGHRYLLISGIAGEGDRWFDHDVFIGELRAIFFDFAGCFDFHFDEGKFAGFGDDSECDAVASGDGFGEEFFGVCSGAGATEFVRDTEGSGISESVACDGA